MTLHWRNPFRPAHIAHAHCDLPCGVYDPAQARIEAESVLQAAEKFAGSEDPSFRQRCVIIKEERAELVKHHLSVLWTDFFKPHHLEKFPQLHDLFWRAGKAAGEAKKTEDPAKGRELIDLIEQITSIFWQAEGAEAAGLYPKS